jgi:hypothetical protein
MHGEKGAGMVRDLTKSTISFSWALSLLGIKQAMGLLTPGQQQPNGDVLGPMTQVAVDQLDDSTKGVFRSGDNLQARAVDLAFASLNPSNWINPGNWMRSVGNFGQQTANGPRGGQQPYANGGQGRGQSPSNGTRVTGQQPHYQTGQGSVTDAALSWLNPFTWLNPNTWLGGRSGGNCGCGQGGARTGQGMWQAGADIGQTVGQVMNQATATFSGQQPQNIGGTAGDSRSANWGPPKES